MAGLLPGGGMNPFHWVVLFAIYSFTGWVIEVAYRSTTQRKFINAGFLHGPFIPIYGFGAAFIVMMEHLLYPLPFAVKLPAYGIVLTGIEYAAGTLFEKAFKLKLWDYSENKFNINGRICLLYSLIWTAMATFFIALVHPFVSDFIVSRNMGFLRIVAILFLAYIAADVVISISSITDFRKKIAYLYDHYFSMSNVEIEKIFDSFRRLRNAFPNLNAYIDNTINIEIKNRITIFMKSIRDKTILDMKARKPFTKEFDGLVRDIYTHGEFMKLKRFYHHNSSIYTHVRGVSYFSYRICKYLKLDYRSAARGALLHDFFLYNWRDHDGPALPKEKNHGIEHPRIALANAEKYFTLNNIERDIIVKHMWPLTLVPPKYKESFVVSFADKYLSSKEFIDEFKKNRKKRHDNKPRKARVGRKRKPTG